MKSIKRVLSIVLMLCIAATLLAACGKTEQKDTGDQGNVTPGGDTNTGEKIVVKYWYPWGGDSETWDLWRVSEFEKKYPQYKFECTYVPEGAGISNGKLAAAVNSGDVPDLVVIDRPTEAYAYATQGGFEQLDDVLDKVGFEWDKINQALLPLMKYDGKTYLIPQNTDTTVLFYRTDLFAEAGLDPNNPPKTMAELDEYAKILTKKDASGNVTQYGFIPWLDAGLDPQTWSWMFGANVYDVNTNKVSLNTPEMIANFKWQMGYAELYDPAAIKSAASSFGEAFSANHAFMTGKVAMTAMGNWFCNAIRIYAPDLEYNIAPLPAPEGGRYGGCALNSNVCAVPRGAKQAEGAVLFALFCQEPYIMDDNNKQWRSLGIYPDRINELTLMKEGDKFLPTIVDITFNENSGMWALTSAATFMNDKLRSGLEECIYNKADPATVLAQIEKEVQAAIDASA
ncbi:MAG TPA: extracellular solute-binding protein [Clostridiales bacterium]|nr:extracellular solute-binding protein [Clostridiales bacterium]HPV01283.1 extracellular solute-binding protein [Clostridiales bacterium]